MIRDLVSIETSELGSGPVFLQSSLWADFKSSFGWSALAYGFDRGGERHRLLVLTRRVAHLASIAYVPHGPRFDDEDGPEDLAGLAALLGERVPGMVLRFDLPWENYDESTAARLAGAGLRPAGVTVQPPDTVLVDLSVEEEAILEGMKPKTRYNIRLAGRKGVVVSPADRGDLPRWYELYRETAGRDRITIHSFAYYDRLFALAEAGGMALRLYLAHHEADLLGGIIVAQVGPVATYLYGASSNTKRNLMAPYALQWEAMKESRRAGFVAYDLFGIPPADDPDHPMYGLYRFKTGFGGRIIHRPGLWDYPLRAGPYALFRAAESIRNGYYKGFRKRGRNTGS